MFTVRVGMAKTAPAVITNMSRDTQPSSVLFSTITQSHNNTTPHIHICYYENCFLKRIIPQEQLLSHPKFLKPMNLYKLVHPFSLFTELFCPERHIGVPHFQLGSLVAENELRKPVRHFETIITRIITIFASESQGFQSYAVRQFLLIDPVGPP